jgi:hypothetical protein
LPAQLWSGLPSLPLLGEGHDRNFYQVASEKKAPPVTFLTPTAETEGSPRILSSPYHLGGPTEF